jgi:hypothetical protein
MSVKPKPWQVLNAAALLLAACLGGSRAAADDAGRIRPWTENPRYWQYKGEPVLLIGGSDTVNLFNHPDSLPPDGLESHLDLMVSVGGNYVRNAMASYSEELPWPYWRDKETGLYDLNRVNPEFWQRFDDLLCMTQARDIIVQIEVWDRFEYARGSWDVNPYNPKNNVNYTADEIGLPERVANHPGQRENPFFRSPPDLEDNPRLLAWQEAHVEKMLSISLRYGNVLYCISNETNDSEEWSRYWAKFLRAKAAEAGGGIEVTEMWDAHDLTHQMHRRTFDDSELYSFVDISQNNHRTGQTHWDNMQAARKLVADPPRPMNNVKIYGGQRHGGGLVEGTHKLWRNVLGGCASARFHRPGPEPGIYGAGLSELAQTHLRSMDRFISDFDVFSAEPDNALLSERAENEAYCMATPGKQYAVYFPDGGAVKLDVSAAEGPLEVRWLDIEHSAWQEAQTADGGGQFELKAPGPGQWAVLVRKK